MTTRTNYPAAVAAEVSARRPDLAANDAIAATLTADPTLTADEVIAILDEAAEEWAAEQAERTNDAAIVAGCTVEHDPSGVGHAWRAATPSTLPADVRLEIECEIIDGRRESCDDYVAQNGQHYRWS